jgi:hypothetical protein
MRANGGVVMCRLEMMGGHTLRRKCRPRLLDCRLFIRLIGWARGN